MNILQNLTQKQIYAVVAGILLLAVIAVGVFCYSIQQKDEIDEPEKTPEKNLIEQTTAPGGPLLTPEEEERLIEETTASQPESLLTPEEEERLIEETSAPGAE